jgi:hypothetical protein
MTIEIASIATLESSECLSAMQLQRFGKAAVPRGQMRDTAMPATRREIAQTIRLIPA